MSVRLARNFHQVLARHFGVYLKFVVSSYCAQILEEEGRFRRLLIFFSSEVASGCGKKRSREIVGWVIEWFTGD